MSMGIYLPNMEMPKSCYKCPLRRRDGMDIVCPVARERFSVADVNILEYRLDNCPIVNVPPHGRLGDLDKLENGLRYMAKYQHGERQQGILGCCETIRLAPTVIPAEPSEEQREYEAAVEATQYCEMYEPTYDPETGAM